MILFNYVYDIHLIFYFQFVFENNITILNAIITWIITIIILGENQVQKMVADCIASAQEWDWESFWWDAWSWRGMGTTARRSILGMVDPRDTTTEATTARWNFRNNVFGETFASNWKNFGTHETTTTGGSPDARRGDDDFQQHVWKQPDHRGDRHFRHPTILNT